MPRLTTAIIHLRDGPGPAVEAGPQLRRLRGVSDVTVRDLDRVIAVRFDERIATLADHLVRTVEDGGTTVCGVAQRPVPAF